ncbi:MAG: OmpA family protein [Desulfatitalea sp.]|nr:OmpA family protein [Desulfatitalea sp.]NNK02557.1 OmpA family protein [Desulfatitalea sp.]
MAKHQEECPKVDPGAPKWVVTFGDLMSLLLCFFVLLLSFSEMDRQKYKQVAGSMEKAFGVQRKIRVMEIPKGMKIIAQDFDQQIIETRIREDLGKEIDDLLSTDLEEYKDQISIEASENEISIRLMGESTFDSGQVVIREKLKPLLKNIAKVLETTNEGIIVAGHTDNVRVRQGGPYSSNLRLSIARAAAVAEFMLTHSKIEPKRISTMGFGQYRPIASNDTVRGREQNRRVEIILGNMPSATQ